MDLLKLPALWLAGPAAAALGVEGRTRKERADNLRADMNAAADDEIDLGQRHLARFVVWWLLAAVTLPVVVAVQVLLNLVDRNVGGFSAITGVCCSSCSGSVAFILRRRSWPITCSKVGGIGKAARGARLCSRKRPISPSR